MMIHAITEMNRRCKEGGLNAFPNSSDCRLKETACDKYSCGQG